MTYNNGNDVKPGVGSSKGLSKMDAIGRYVAKMLICMPCKKSSVKTNQASQLDPIEKPHEPESPTPAMEQALDDELDNIVARIDAAVATQDEETALVLHLHELKGASPCQSKDKDDPPGVYTSLDSAQTASSEVIAAINKSAEDSTIEVKDLRSFDLEASMEYKDFDPSDLGRQHSSMHVRNCTSRVCASCQREEGVYFIKPKPGG